MPKASHAPASSITGATPRSTHLVVVAAAVRGIADGVDDGAVAHRVEAPAQPLAPRFELSLGGRIHRVGVAAAARSSGVARVDEHRAVGRDPVWVAAHLEEGPLMNRRGLHLLDQLLGLPLGELRLVGEDDPAEEPDLDPID